MLSRDALEEIRPLKKSRGQAFIIGAFFLIAAGAIPSQAEDVTIVFRVWGADWERVATHYYSATKVRFDQGEQVTVVDFKTGRIVNISVKKKEYSETTFAEIEQAMNSVSAEMEKAMAGIPEGLRKKMVGDSAKEVTISRGEGRTVASIPCQTYIVALGEKTRMETCVTLELDLPFDKSQFRNLALVTAPIAKGNSGINKMVEKLRDIEGLSLASATVVSLMGKKLETWSEATEIRKGKVANELFETPHDFRKVDSPFAKTAH